MGVSSPSPPATRRCPSRIGTWAFVVLLGSSLLSLAETQILSQPDGASAQTRRVPLPLLLESLRHDVLQGRLSRSARHAYNTVPDDSVPWYSSATRAGEEALAQEELKVTSVTKREKFNFGAGVKKWHSIAAGSTTYLVGLGAKQFTLITAHFVAPDVGTGQTYSLSESVHPLPSNPLAATVFKHWNAASKTMDVILVLSTENEGSLTWYRINSNDVKAIRSWPVHKRVSHIRVFKIKEQMKLLILTSCEPNLELVECEASADVFDFNLGNSLEARLSWSEKLDSAAASGEIGAAGDEVYLVLALPDANVARLYRYHVPGHSKSSEGSFKFWKDFPSPQVAHAVFFHVSYKMYLAVGGAKPSLFRFVSPTRIEGCPKALQNLGFVSAWLILPIQTYRDEVVVLAEILHTDHSKGVVTLTWSSAGVFNRQQYPCYVDGQLYEGATCIIAEGRELGLAGAVNVQLGDASVVSVLLPKGSVHSALYDFQTKLEPNMNPLLSEILILKEAQANLESALTSQTNEMKATERLLLDTVNPHGHNVIKADWVIQEIETQEFEATKQAPVWPAEPTVDILEIKSMMSELKSLTERLSDSLSDAAVPVNGELHLTGHQTLLGGLDVLGKTYFDFLSVGQLNGESVHTLLKDSVRIDQLEREILSGTKILPNLKANNVQFNMVNDVGKDDLIFNVPNQTARVHGILEVTEVLHVQTDVEIPPEGTVGGLDLSEEVFMSGKEFQGIVQFDEVTVEGDLRVDVINQVNMKHHNLKSIGNGTGFKETFDTLEVEGQLNVERINGFSWNDIAKRIVWRDLPSQIPETTEIDGSVTASRMKIEQLNGLNFPHDFVLKGMGIGNQQITATKSFRKMAVGTVEHAKTIDGVPVEALVTLTTDQNLNGELKLKEADINGDIKVNGAVNGIKMNQRQSPPLGPGVVVSSNVQFTNLTVVGPIVIINTLDEKIFKDVVQDILVLPPTLNEPVILGGKKTVSSLKIDNVIVSSGLVNGLKISDIARVDSPLTFQGEKTIQNAVFENLVVAGKWDDVNVVDLNAEAVRLNGVQDTNSHLTFTDSSSSLVTSHLLISEQINAFTATSVPSRDECEPSLTDKLACVLKGSVTTDSMKIGGNVYVKGKVCGWSLDEFERRRMSRSQPQTIKADYTFGEIAVSNHINVNQINGLPVGSLGRNTAPPPPPSHQDLAKLLVDGEFAIDELVIEGHIETMNGVNLRNLTAIAHNAIKLIGGNTISGSLEFEDLLSAGTLDVTGPVNRYNLAFQVEDAVLKSSPRVTLQGRKTFNSGFNVKGMLKTNTLNGLIPSTIVTKTTPATIHGLLKVVGMVTAGNINLSGLLNNVPVTVYQNRYKLDPSGRHVLIGDVHFSEGVSIDELSAMKSVQRISFDDFFASVVMKNDSAQISGTKIFVNKVVFQNVAVRGRVNNLTLGEMASDIVLHNDDLPVTIDGKIVFEDTLTVSRGISLTGDLVASELYGCSVKEWQDNAVYLSQPTSISGNNFFAGVKSFESVRSNSDLKLLNINAVDLAKVITLHTQQDIPSDLTILGAAVQHNLDVAGSVNGYKLQSEYDNTLMTEGTQIVTGHKTFLKGFSAKNNVLTSSYISGRNISNSVTLDSDETVSGPLKFSNMVVDQDLRASGLISGLDVQKWNDRALLKMAPVPQVVTGSYDVQGKIRCMQSIGGSGLLAGESVLRLADMASKKRSLTRILQEDIKIEWTQMCHDTDALLEKARAQPFLFRQLEVVQSIVSIQPIASMHAFEALNAQFLAVSYSNKCSGAMYHWSREKTAWELMDGAVENIGSVEKWVSLKNSGSTYLVTSSAATQNCSYQGGNIWQIESDHRPRNIYSMDAWQDAEIDESTGHVHLLRQSGVDKLVLKDGVASPVTSWPLSETGAPSKFIPRSAGIGLSISVGDNVTVLEKPEDTFTSSMAPRSPNLQARNIGNLVTMKIAGGRKLVAVTAEGADLLVVYEDLVTAKPLASVKVRGAHSLCVLELTAPGRSGQTLLAFIEDERHLRVVEYKGVQGFVDVTRAKLPFAVKEMIPVRLHARAFVNQRHFLLLRSDHQVLLLEVEMSGDPLDEDPLNCNL
ncbi:39S ribosomal protein L16, mitochondrial [Frankliniella fusca]|uniref:39S ribosomal protein L16, mitochondrial n=1 Tax=Frankliniella fusca TaxID=407009 RepID=A0AAE1L666_9NEOP|nr:39S ribosomal protein L16, mitochondrial [Frankliniella fusca]